MRIKNKHGRIGVRQTEETLRKKAFRRGYEEGFSAGQEYLMKKIQNSSSLKTLKKELGF